MLDEGDVPYYDAYKQDWSAERDIPIETDHKTNDRVILCFAAASTRAFGTLAESGLCALNAFIRGQAFGIYVEDHPGNPDRTSVRTRILIKEHIKKINQQFPGAVFLADSPEELGEFAVKIMKETQTQ